MNSCTRARTGPSAAVDAAASSDRYGRSAPSAHGTGLPSPASGTGGTGGRRKLDVRLPVPIWPPGSGPIPADADGVLARAGDIEDAGWLGKGVARWRLAGSLDLPPGSEPEELDGWLERVLAGEASPEPSVRAGLGVLGLRWRATADRDAPPVGPDPGADAGLPPRSEERRVG